MPQIVTIDYAAFDRNRKLGREGERDTTKAEPIFCIHDQDNPKNITYRTSTLMFYGPWELHGDIHGRNAQGTGSVFAVTAPDLYTDYDYVVRGPSLKRRESDHYPIDMPSAVMHVNQTLLYKNRADGGNRPVFAHRDRQGRGLALHAWGVRSREPLGDDYPRGYFIYSPYEALLPCGARLVWVADRSKIELLDENGNDFRGLAYEEACAGGCPIEQFERFEAPEEVKPYEEAVIKKIAARVMEGF